VLEVRGGRLEGLGVLSFEFWVLSWNVEL
jgi:hypothetical protein